MSFTRVWCAFEEYICLSHHEGRPDLNCSTVQDQLASGVKSIYAAMYAFAVLKADGSVVAWGDLERGRHSSKIWDHRDID